MRRNNFLIGAVSALITFVTLSAFVDRPWHHRWHDRYHHHYYDDNDRDRNNDRNDDRPQNRKTDSTNY